MYTFPLAVYLVVKLLGYRLYVCSTLIDSARVLKWLYQSVLLSAGVRVLVSPHPHQHFVLSAFQVFIIVLGVRSYLSVVLF